MHGGRAARHTVTMETRALTAPTARPLRDHLAQAVKGLHPAYFAMVMATGVVSIVSDLLGLAEAAAFLLWVNVPAYLVLWALFVARAIRFPGSSPATVQPPARPWVLHLGGGHLRAGPPAGRPARRRARGLCAVVAGAAALVRLHLRRLRPAERSRKEKPTLGQGINGGWLLAVVATQSVCVLGCKVLAPRFAGEETVTLLLASLWLCGGMLYVWMISLIFYRYMFFEFSPSDLMPPYWMNMGAVAISVVAGTSLAGLAPGSALLGAVLPFVKGSR